MYDRNLSILPYDREKAVNYAHQWAYGRNPLYYDFEEIGGDCTNFASQVIFSGSGIMNLKPIYGWHYVNSNYRTASWTGVNFLYDFLVNNGGEGPFAEEVDVKDIKRGDIIQLSFSSGRIFNHTPVVVETGYQPSLNNIKIAAHTDNQDYYSILKYDWVKIRFIHIIGVRKF